MILQQQVNIRARDVSADQACVQPQIKLDLNALQYYGKLLGKIWVQ